jgi:hypothetical protein
LVTQQRLSLLSLSLWQRLSGAAAIAVVLTVLAWAAVL